MHAAARKFGLAARSAGDVLSEPIVSRPNLVKKVRGLCCSLHLSVNFREEGREYGCCTRKKTMNQTTTTTTKTRLHFNSSKFEQMKRVYRPFNKKINSIFLYVAFICTLNSV